MAHAVDGAAKRRACGHAAADVDSVDVGVSEPRSLGRCCGPREAETVAVTDDQRFDVFISTPYPDARAL